MENIETRAYGVINNFKINLNMFLISNQEKKPFGFKYTEN